MEGLYLCQLVLFALGVCLLLCEAASPGVGLPAVGGISLLLGCFLPALLRGIAPWYVFLLLIVACICLLLDSNTPGLGPLACLGLLLLFFGLYLCDHRLRHLLLALLLSALFSIPALYVILTRLPSSKSMRQLALNERLQGSGLPPAAQIVGRTGVALSDLKPGGLVRLDGERLHATAQEGFIEKGSAVTVLACRNGEALVRRAQEQNDA